jgi:hypothetical protein
LHYRNPRTLTGFVTALSADSELTLKSEGAVTCPATPSLILPGSLLRLTGVCPLHARAIVIYCCHIPWMWFHSQIENLQIVEAKASVLILVHKTAHAHIHYNTQRQKHKQDGRPAITH